MLDERLGLARGQGREPGPLLAALREADAAVQQAALLLERQRALLAGVDVERSHNRVRAFMARMEESAGQGDPAELLRDAPPRRSLCLPAGAGSLAGLRWSPDGRRLAGLTGDRRRLLLWDPGADEEPEQLELPQGQATALAFHPTREILFAACGDGLHLADLGTGRWQCGVQRRPAPSTPSSSAVRCLCIAHDGSWLALGLQDGGLQRFALDPTGELRLLEHQRRAHDQAVTGLVASPDDLQLFSAGGGELRQWWVRGDCLIGFTRKPLAGAELLDLSSDGRRLVVGQGHAISWWDQGLSRMQGRCIVMGRVQGMSFASDGQRVLIRSAVRLEIGSPSSRRVFPLASFAAGSLRSAACSPDALRVACFLQESRDKGRLELLDLGAVGLAGMTRRALRQLRRATDLAGELSRELDRERRTSLLGQLRGLVRDAGLSVVYAVTRSAQAVEEAARRGGELGSVHDQLDLLFAELHDVEALMVQAVEVAPALEDYLAKLRQLPIAVLRGHVDVLMEAIERLIRSTEGAAEERLKATLLRLAQLEKHALGLEGLANGLSGSFWGNPERPRLVEALGRLRRDFPTYVDALVARIASSAIGRLDPLEEELGLDELAAHRARIGRRSGGRGEVAEEADWLLEKALGEGPLGKDETERERGRASRDLDAEWRRLDAETRAFLELHRLTRA